MTVRVAINGFGRIGRHFYRAVRSVRAEAEAAGTPWGDLVVVAANELGSLREAFMTNVRWGLRSVARLEEYTLPTDEGARRLRAAITELN